MIVDGHVHISNEPEPARGWPAFTADDLIALMDEKVPIKGTERVIDRAAVMPMPLVTQRPDLTFREQHRAVIEAVRKHPGRLVGTFMLNPHLGVDRGVRELRRLVEEEGFRMVKLHPTAHGYWPKMRNFTDPVLDAAAELRIPVLIHTGDPPFAIPALMEPLATDHPNTTVILAHLGTQKGGYADDAINVARHCDNVLLETGWGHQPRVAEAVQEIGAARLVFGSDCPVQEPYSQLRIIETLTRPAPLGVNLSDDDMEAIMGGNLAGLLKLNRG